ncbi:cupin-like domain-containing protein [Shewanella salipaludis]|uniref:Cupin-like domain-containing protein n=1 Tax=Shewanella salipaludis TaxID=2723052 RepID=A0A972FUT7_9GAMM|nr:cupin-like domain-containing protein [Shewanella salipaludis]NMH65719.1 cupin-like domain-containing protein [Shewanella salipaludis]
MKAAAPVCQTARVKRLEQCSLDEMKALIATAETPLVFGGLCSHWPLVQAGLRSSKQAMTYLAQFYQGMPVTAYHVAPEHDGRVFYNETLDGFNYQAGKLDLRHLLERLQAEAEADKPAGIYMGSTEIQRCLPGLGIDNSLDLAPIAPLINIWLGNPSRIAAHLDLPHNLACNAVGKRTFTLFPPEQVGNLYIGPMAFAPGGQDISLVDPDKPDLERFPRFAMAMEAALTAELEAGDVLFIPSMWWHHVRASADFNVLITHWWRDTPDYLGRPNNALLHAILSLRSLPKAQRQAWKAMFDHYIFDHDPEALAHIPEAAQGMLTTPLDESNARKLRADLTNKLKR